MEFKNGDKKIWRRPYPPNWAFFERHLAYQFQKWDLATNQIDRTPLLQRDLAEFLAFQYRDENNPPIKMTLIKETAMWPPPNEWGFVRSNEKTMHWVENPIFIYDLVEKKFLTVATTL